jgi:hypothetical protein
LSKELDILTKVLVIYSTAMTTAMAALTWAGPAAARVQERPQFSEIDVQRINVREPDGTLRLVIANHARLPGVIVRGKELPPVDRSYVGLLFYNDEGDRERRQSQPRVSRSQGQGRQSGRADAAIRAAWDCGPTLHRLQSYGAAEPSPTIE